LTRIFVNRNSVAASAVKTQAFGYRWWSFACAATTDCPSIIDTFDRCAAIKTARASTQALADSPGNAARVEGPREH